MKLRPGFETRSGYRVYRDSYLIYPLSNGFEGTPMVVGMLGLAATVSWPVAASRP